MKVHSGHAKKKRLVMSEDEEDGDREHAKRKVSKPAQSATGAKPLASIFAKPAAASSSTAAPSRENGADHPDEDDEGESEIDDEAQEEEEGQAAVKLYAKILSFILPLTQAERRSSPRPPNLCQLRVRAGKMVNRV